MFKIVNEVIDDPAIKKFKDLLSKDENGASVIFEGIVRNHNEGKEVKSLEYQAYQSMAEREGSKIVNEALKKFKITSASCIHRVGHLDINDIAVWVIATSHHRQDAFHACQYIIDNVKFRVPIWKREHYLNSEPEWVSCHTCHEQAEQYQAMPNIQCCKHNHE